MSANRLFAIGCDNVLYAQKSISAENWAQAFLSVGKNYQFPVSVLKRGIFYIRQRKFNHLYNLTLNTSHKYHLPYQEITEKFAGAIDYSSIQPNQPLLKALEMLAQKNEICIYTHQTEPYVNAVFQRLFGKDVAHCTGISLFHIGTLQSGNEFCSKYTPKSLWLLSKTFATAFEEIHFLDDFNNLNTVKPPVGKTYRITYRHLPDLLNFFANDEISCRAKCIRRHTPSPFDRRPFLSAKISEKLLYIRE